jgi:hypothetical protein
LAEAAAVENVRGDFERSLRDTVGRGGVRHKFNGAVDHLFGIQRFADLEDRCLGQEAESMQAQQAVGFVDFGPRQCDHATSPDGIAHGFRDTFSDPIERSLGRIGGGGPVGKGQNGGGVGEKIAGKGGESDSKREKPADAHST